MSAAADSVAKLEAELRAARLNGARALREMHAHLARDLADAEQRVRRAEKQAARAERRATKAERAVERADKQGRQAVRRARQAERELTQLRQSATWRAGRAVVAVPARLRRLGRR